MKKLVTIIILGCMVLGLVGCGNSNNAGKEQGSTSIDKVVESESQVAEENGESNIEWYYTHKVPGHQIVINAPNYQNVELGYTELYIIHQSKFVFISFEDEDYFDTITDLKHAHELSYNSFRRGVQNYNFNGPITILKEDYVTINDVDMYRYEGTIKAGYGDNKYDCYALGYSFIMDGVPCTVGGAIIEEAQSDELIKGINDTVEAMIRTLRTER